MILLVLFAFLAGIVTILSPCILPVLPLVLSAGAGGGKSRPLGVVVGFVAGFTFFTLFLSSIVRLTGISADSLRLASVAVIAVLGLSLLIPKFQFLFEWLFSSISKFSPKAGNKTGFVSGIIVGLSVGLLWTPCVGPILAAVISLALAEAVTLNVALITLAYALGAAVPMFLIILGGRSVLERLPRLTARAGLIQKGFGVVMIAVATLIFFNLDRRFQAYILKTFPGYGAGLTKFEDRRSIRKQLENLKNIRPADDFTGAKIKKEDLIQGCPAQDCIPSIDNPKFESAEDANTWLNPDDRVFAVNYSGVVRAYPQRILNWHEIVNDDLGGLPAAITFCPLCGSALVFERKVNGVVAEFGVSGKLHNSDLVMYDRYEGNLWQQITGEAIVGPAARRNEILTKIPIITVDWNRWRQQHPETLVLSRDTGFARNYHQYPYGTYEQDDQLLFGVKNLDRSLPPKTVVYGVEIGGKSKAYPQDAFDRVSKINDKIGEISITLEKKNNGEIAVTNAANGDKIIPTRLFWFAWAAFHPETEIYAPPPR